MGASNDRRTRVDRREIDVGPPVGWSDRRKSVERRLPAAEEAEISAEDFTKYFGSDQPLSASSDHLLDHASEVFDRVRDKY